MKALAFHDDTGQAGLGTTQVRGHVRRTMPCPSTSPADLASRSGFTLVEVLAATAVLTIALLPALTVFNLLLKSADHLAITARARAAVTLRMADTVLAARAGQVPAPVQNGFCETPGVRRLNWTLHANPIAGGAGPAAALVLLQCTVTDNENRPLALGSMRLAVPPREISGHAP